MKDLTECILQAHKRSFRRAFEVAVRTNTALIYTHQGKIVKIKPPYKYKLVPTKGKKKA